MELFSKNRHSPFDFFSKSPCTIDFMIDYNIININNLLLKEILLKKPLFFLSLHYRLNVAAPFLLHARFRVFMKLKSELPPTTTTRHAKFFA